MALHGIWGTQDDDPTLTVVDGPQRRLAADIATLVDDPLIAKQIVCLVADHLMVTASERLLSQQYKGYAATLRRVGERMPQTRPTTPLEPTDAAHHPITHDPAGSALSDAPQATA
jgi:hypothetical protein